ncbi:ATP-binding cassette domain-containing protein, partial [Pseudomonadales bacterium]|nr:ATP-binding cassette domain-containing protein [Pseudomonadales bacterium]
MSRTVVSVEAVEKVVPTAAGSLVILDGIDLEIKQGETVAIVGASGSGKTTLLGILAGLDEASAGRVMLVDEEISSLDEEARAKVRGLHVGFVFQSFQLLGSLTALENVMLPVELRGDTLAESQATELLAKVGLADRIDHYPRQLSGGEQQRVAIARAFASAPTVLFADEPTGNLDTQTGALICDLLFDLNREFGTTLIMVTHDGRLAERCA